MKTHYNIELNCVTCGDTNFEFNDDKSWIKCTRCNREYLGGYDELVQYNMDGENIKQMKKEIQKDVQNEITNMFKKALKGGQNIKFK